MRESKVFAVAGLLTALSFALNFLPFFKVPWGMQLDFVGVAWVVAFLLYGLRTSFLVSLATSVLFALFTPGGWIGAVMKFTTTFTPILLAYVITYLLRKQGDAFKNTGIAVITLILAVAVRGFVATTLNLFAIPLFTGWPLSSVTPLIPEIILLNSVLALLDFAVAWVIAFKFGLFERFASQ